MISQFDFGVPFHFLILGDLIGFSRPSLSSLQSTLGVGGTAEWLQWFCGGGHVSIENDPWPCSGRRCSQPNICSLTPLNIYHNSDLLTAWVTQCKQKDAQY